LHLKYFYKFHLDHHLSSVPSPFSAYSFHWVEGLILGSVMPIIMVFHDFQFYSIMTLPVMSIVLNVLGHSNVNFFPKAKSSSLLSFSRNHSLHHLYPKTNFGFLLPWFDQVFKTNSTN
jgi:sterol desaturase/sphingolipid hydroxylase (fatty acid hydroxylase superfamily)